MMSKQCRVYLCRHGETQWNTQKKLQGCDDSPLTEQGKQQVSLLAQSIHDLPIQFCYSSHLGRAKKSAKLCLNYLGITDVPLQVNRQLHERNFGKWQGHLFSHLTGKSLFNEVFNQVSNLAPPQGETGIECAKRVYAAIHQIGCRHRGQIGLIVTHGEAIRCLLSILLASRERQMFTQDAFSSITNGMVLPLLIGDKGVELDAEDLRCPQFLKE